MKALIITGKYAQDIEVWYPKYRMEEEGWQVEIATPNKQEVLGVYGMKITPTCFIPPCEQLAAKQRVYDVVILPGGARAMEYLRQDEQMLLYLYGYHGIGGVIGSICHGTQLLISAKLVQGKFITGYYSIRDDIVNAGGFYPAGDAPFTTDGRIITSSHYKHLGPWMHECIRVVAENAKPIS